LSYKNTAELNKIIDTKLPAKRPTFTKHECEVAGETFDLYSRDIIECIKALYGDPQHAEFLTFAPERHYNDADKTSRLYHEMHTGEWWWTTQVSYLSLKIM
jgi:Plavaka transposase